MKTRGNTVETAPLRPMRHTRALPTAAGHRQCSDDTPPRTHGANPAPADRDEETTRQPQDHLVSPEVPTMDFKPAAAEPIVNRDDPRQVDLAREVPLVQPDNARPRNTLH